jgi:hypothetical protein
MVTKMCQTEIDMKEMKEYDRQNKDFFKNLSNCLADLFAIPVQAESQIKRNNIIETAITKHFGIKLGDTKTNSDRNGNTITN